MTAQDIGDIICATVDQGAMTTQDIDDIICATVEQGAMTAQDTDDIIWGYGRTESDDSTGHS